LGAGVTLWITWQITTVIGILLGSIVPEELGLTFTIPLTFLALLINYFRKIDHVIVIIASGVLSIIMYDAPFKSYIIFSSLISLLIAYLIVKMRKQNI
jgi:predicted branched-subunit amino acid permease